MGESLSKQEQLRRKELSEQARSTIIKTLPVEDEDESSLMLGYEGFYLQIAFSALHPLMVLYLARSLNRPSTQRDRKLINEMNLRGVPGSYAINDDVGCYSYRAACWLDTELSRARFLEILGRLTEEAARGYHQLLKAS